jgi:methylated-DNA-protein-cysteine methyltransferase related protein
MLATIRDTIRLIPRGKVSSYGDVAKAAGFPGRARQVVWALRNARGLPWHRVVGAGGKIMLPGENGLEQRMRLETEGVIFRGGRVRMEEHQFEFAPSVPKSGAAAHQLRARRRKLKRAPAARGKRTGSG